jgi:hypothetical protein
MTKPKQGAGGPNSEREPTSEEWERVFRQIQADRRFDPDGVPEPLRDEIARQVLGASSARLAVMTAAAPFGSLLSGDLLSGTVLMDRHADRSEWTELPFEIRRLAPDGDRFVLHLKGLPDRSDPLSFLAGDLRLARADAAPLFCGPLRVPRAWQPKPSDGKAKPASEPDSSSKRELQVASGTSKYHAAFDDGEFDDGKPQRQRGASERRIVESVDVRFVDSDEGSPVCQLRVDGAVHPERDSEVVIAEVLWRRDGSSTRRDTHVVRLERNPDWARHTTMRRGTVNLNVPHDVAAGDVQVIVRQVAGNDLPKHLQDVFGDGPDLMPLPLIVEEGEHVFRVRYDDERDALSAAGRTGLLNIVWDLGGEDA